MVQHYCKRQYIDKSNGSRLTQTVLFHYWYMISYYYQLFDTEETTGGIVKGVITIVININKNLYRRGIIK